MSQAEEAIADSPSQQHLPSLLLAVFSLLGITSSWMISFFFLAGAVSSGFLGDFALFDRGESLRSASVFFFYGLVMLPPAWLSIARLRRKKLEIPQALQQAGNWMWERAAIIFLVSLAVGGGVSLNADISWLLLPILHLISVSLLVAWLLRVGTQSIDIGSAQRRWGAFGSGVSLSVILSIGVEIFVGLFFFVVLFAYLSGQGELLNDLGRLFSQLDIESIDPTELLPHFAPLFSDPIILLIVLGYISLAVPLIEELFKPIAVWLLIKRPLDGRDGFVLGALSGAGFALFENLSIGVGAESWLGIVVARIGTTAMHIFAAGFVGWAIVHGKNEKKYGLVLASYGLSVLLHGLWNSMAVIGGFASLGMLSGTELLPTHFVISSWLVLLILAIGSIIMLRKSNRRLGDLQSN